ncbi:MAG: PadR family transcriptional regulator [Actinomycetota bacterium]
MTPVFAHGHLRLYLLNLLAERPMHGYELIQELGDRFGGTYIPSAGTIYPRLGKLEEDGLVTKTADGRKTVYEITDAGRAELESRRSELDGIENDVSDSVRRLADGVRASVTDAMRTLRADLAAAAREATDDARQAGRSTKAEPQHVRVSGQLNQAESIVEDFRHQLRTDLRTMAAKGVLSDGTAELLRTQLAAVRSAVRSLSSN